MEEDAVCHACSVIPVVTACSIGRYDDRIVVGGGVLVALAAFGRANEEGEVRILRCDGTGHAGVFVDVEQAVAERATGAKFRSVGCFGVVEAGHGESEEEEGCHGMVMWR